MKRLLILVLVFAFMFTFSLGIMAQEEDDVRWPDNAGDDPVTEEGWTINEGTLEGWEDSNFETLEYKDEGQSEEVGTGITVDGIKVDWDYPEGDIGKGGEVEDAFNQSIDYTVAAFAEIPCVLKMNVFGNGNWVEAISVGDESHIEFDLPSEGIDISEDNRHLMLFDSSMGSIVDAGWNFMDDLGAEEYTEGSVDKYIHANDLWTAEVWGNVPYGFTVSSDGLSNGEQVLDLEMRYLESPIAIGDPDNGNAIPLDNDDVTGWSADYVLNAHPQGVEIGQYNAGATANINMQFRVPLNESMAGNYGGEVRFSTYTM